MIHEDRLGCNTDENHVEEADGTAENQGEQVDETAEDYVAGTLDVAETDGKKNFLPEAVRGYAWNCHLINVISS